jgi:hypothetical protein
MNAGCGGYVHHDLAPSTCEDAPTVVGLRFSPHDRTVWLGFACDVHAQELIAPRVLLPRDRDVLHRRRALRSHESRGRRWAGLREGPLARGAAAEQLVDRALAWASRHE